MVAPAATPNTPKDCTWLTWPGGAAASQVAASVFLTQLARLRASSTTHSARHNGRAAPFWVLCQLPGRQPTSEPPSPNHGRRRRLNLPLPHSALRLGAVTRVPSRLTRTPDRHSCRSSLSPCRGQAAAAMGFRGWSECCCVTARAGPVGLTKRRTGGLALPAAFTSHLSTLAPASTHPPAPPAALPGAGPSAAAHWPQTAPSCPAPPLRSSSNGGSNGSRAEPR